MKKYVVIALVAIVATVIVLYFVPGSPIYEQDENPVVDLTHVDDPTPSSSDPQPPQEVPPTRQETPDPTAVEYGAMLNKAKSHAKLIATKDTMPAAAESLVDALPAPPPPTGNCAADAPEGECHWPTRGDLEEWEDEFETVAQQEAGRNRGEGLFQLLTLACPIGAASVGVPPQAGMPVCEMLIPLLDGLGMSLGEGDDIEEAVAALQGVQNGDYSKLKDFALNHPETRKRLPEIMNWIEQIHPDVRSRFAGIDLNDSNICDIVLSKLAEEAAEELPALTQAGTGRERAVMERLAGTIRDPAIRARVERAIAGDVDPSSIQQLVCPP